MGSVAIYDDDAAIEALLQELLETEGIDVVVCGSLLQLHQAAIAGARVAIADTWGASHQELEQAERDQIVALARLIPTILISGRAWACRVNATELGLVALIKKPFDVDELVSRVQPFLRPPTDLRVRHPLTSH